MVNVNHNVWVGSTTMTEPVDFAQTQGLSAEGLMLYLQTRMNNIDGQVNAIFDKMQKMEKIRKHLADIQNELNQLNDDATNGNLQGTVHEKDVDLADYEAKISACIDAIAQIDPVLAKELEDSLSVKGQILHCLDGLYLTNEVSNTREYINSISKQLESGAQMDMIRLQSFMSTRGTFIQMTTNLISSLNEPMKSVVGNMR